MIERPPQEFIIMEKLTPKNMILFDEIYNPINEIKFKLNEKINPYNPREIKRPIFDGIIPLRQLNEYPKNYIEIPTPELDAMLAKWKILTPNAEQRRPYQFPEAIDLPAATPAKPVDSRPLKDRLVWTSGDPKVRKGESDRRRQVSTDRVRDRLLDRYHRHNIDVLTQVRLIHRAHMKGNEHYLLYPDQARRVIDGVLYTTDRLAGVMRSPQRLSLDICLAGGLVQCASYERTPEFMQAVAVQAEKLFPAQGINPNVDEGNIYHFASAFQYIIAIIHPFYEANGRTSEDSMYILWKRRADLAQTLRYVSSNGLRNGENVNLRMRIINTGAHNILLNIARELGVEPERLSEINSHSDLMTALNRRGVPSERASAAYSQIFDRHIQELITRFTDISYLKKHTVINALADHLKNSPKTYDSKAA